MNIGIKISWAYLASYTSVLVALLKVKVLISRCGAEVTLCSFFTTIYWFSQHISADEAPNLYYS